MHLDEYKPPRILTIGTFDLFHAGHLNLLKKCTQITPNVIVGVNSDEFVKKYKGKPVMTQDERKGIIRDLGYTAHINKTKGAELIEVIRPEILAIGSDWARKDYLKQIGVTQDQLDEWGVSVIYIPYYKGISSTEIKRRVLSNSDSTPTKTDKDTQATTFSDRTA